jgi:hypothetical protein
MCSEDEIQKNQFDTRTYKKCIGARLDLVHFYLDLPYDLKVSDFRK